jgi:hypothetical protein
MKEELRWLREQNTTLNWLKVLRVWISCCRKTLSKFCFKEQSAKQINHHLFRSSTVSLNGVHPNFAIDFPGVKTKLTLNLKHPFGLYFLFCFIITFLAGLCQNGFEKPDKLVRWRFALKIKTI